MKLLIDTMNLEEIKRCNDHYKIEWDDIEKFVQVQETLDPDVDKHAQYEPYKQIFNDSYYALVDIYDKLAQIPR